MACSHPHSAGLWRAVMARITPHQSEALSRHCGTFALSLLARRWPRLVIAANPLYWLRRHAAFSIADRSKALAQSGTRHRNYAGEQATRGRQLRSDNPLTLHQGELLSMTRCITIVAAWLVGQRRGVIQHC